jgi:hypothetical protein
MPIVYKISKNRYEIILLVEIIVHHHFVTKSTNKATEYKYFDRCTLCIFFCTGLLLENDFG